MATDSNILSQLTSAEYKEIYTDYLPRFHGRENAHHCISKILFDVALSEQNDLRVLLIGPGAGEVELQLLSSHKIAHLTAVEPNVEMANELEANLHASGTFITTWNIHRTTVESFLIDKAKNDAPFSILLMIHSVYYVESCSDVLLQLRSLLQPQTGRLILVVVGGYFARISRMYNPSSKHTYDADNLERDLHDVNIPFECHSNRVTVDLTNVKGNKKLEWVFASFYCGGNAASRGEDFATQVVTDLLNWSQPTKDGELELVCRDDVFVIKSAD